MDVLSNQNLLKNIRDIKCDLVLFCNAGKTLVTKKGKQVSSRGA